MSKNLEEIKRLEINLNRVERSLVDACFYYIKDVVAIVDTTMGRPPEQYSIWSTDNGVRIRFNGINVHIVKTHDNPTTCVMYLKSVQGDYFSISPLTILRAMTPEMKAETPPNKLLNYRYMAALRLSVQWTKSFKEFKVWENLVMIPGDGEH